MRFQEQMTYSFQLIVDYVKFAVAYLQVHPLVHYMIITAIFIVVLLLLLSIRKKGATEDLVSVAATPASSVVTGLDMSAIAGDDVISTQLDLAKAYIEMEQKELARDVLQHALKQGSASQQQEARQLLVKTL